MIESTFHFTQIQNVGKTKVLRSSEDNIIITLLFMIFIIKVSDYKSKLKTFSLPKKLALGTSTDKETLKSKPISKFVLFNFYIKKSLLCVV